jgi:hypothetical protein
VPFALWRVIVGGLLIVMGPCDTLPRAQGGSCQSQAQVTPPDRPSFPPGEKGTHSCTSCALKTCSSFPVASCHNRTIRSFTWPADRMRRPSGEKSRLVRDARRLVHQRRPELHRLGVGPLRLGRLASQQQRLGQAAPGVGQVAPGGRVLRRLRDEFLQQGERLAELPLGLGELLSRPQHRGVVVVRRRLLLLEQGNVGAVSGQPFEDCDGLVHCLVGLAGPAPLLQQQAQPHPGVAPVMPHLGRRPALPVEVGRRLGGFFVRDSSTATPAWEAACRSRREPSLVWVVTRERLSPARHHALGHAPPETHRPGGLVPHGASQFLVEQEARPLPLESGARQRGRGMRAAWRGRTEPRDGGHWRTSLGPASPQRHRRGRALADTIPE